MLQKRLSGMWSLVECVHQHGIASDEFKSVFDLQESQLALPPVVDLRMPDFIKRQRHAREISQCDETGSWLSRTSSGQLRANGTANVADEQMRLWSERLSLALKGADSKQPTLVLKPLYNLEYDYEQYR